MNKIFRISMLSAFLLAGMTVEAQTKASPAATAEGTVENAEVTVKYHQPSAKGRTIYGELVPYDAVWRTGANNATTFETSDDMMIEGKKLPKGRYGLFTIPGKDEWTIIFNSNADQWGANDYSAEEDVLRVKVKSGKTKEFVETFNIEVVDNSMMLVWADTKVKVKLGE